MAPRYGSLDLPLPEPPTAEAALTDPALDTLLAFAKAVIDDGAADAWEAVAGDEKVPVKSTFAHNPEEIDFNTKSLPALYLFRAGAAEPPMWVADDYRIAKDELHLLWVFPWAHQGVQRRRTTFVNGLLKVLDAALANERHPAWVAAGDTDPDATRGGSNILRHAGLWSLMPGKWQRAPVEIVGEDQRMRFWAIRLPLFIEERLVRADGEKLSAVLTVQTTDDPPFEKSVSQL